MGCRGSEGQIPLAPLNFIKRKSARRTNKKVKDDLNTWQEMVYEIIQKKSAKDLPTR